MSAWELVIIAVGLSMDAFAVAICKGLAMKKATIKNAIIVGLWFGIFQALMPLIGYYVGSLFAENIKAYDHWIALILLSIIGIEMISNALSKKEKDKEENPSLSIKTMFVMAVATSIDALAVGVGFAFFEINIFLAIIIIGIITFALSVFGVKIGGHFGIKYKKKAELAGGIILILIGIKIVLEHLGVINF
jgi:putative Mn2+ efflux pump MntP